ncbi:hypothetical protein DICSQDRAFT_163437 [Dichomitus squalens LYAD-421 SS1]|uniref:RING-type domain-containing protein n=1 Tax=Dichomitus squalens (strain LYAD-421) TaxID=732165 RepID=R7SML1_DICSQ|nr:uncharacterized protein DICSQDRAFT_163437 [Dichomitus squalens LYAD-421 SS1]EJF57371.1 hypothetical protein DICSQDRAFT_163437 [Dichomitus squalens LYAD-421 SS1]
MASFAAWYNHQYSSWNRVRSIHQQPYIARVDTNTSRTATRMASQNPVVIDMGTPAPAQGQGTAQAAAATAGSKGNDTLFGPNIGVLGGGPEWTESQDKSSDVLTPEIVKGWIAKSKETHYSTTTLQALVNLKRPTLRLSPLENDASEDADHVDSQHHHALEFEYDCDAPKCAIRVHVHLSPKHPLAGKPDVSGLSKLLVFETITDGGFGKLLKLEDGAMLELGRFDHKRASSPSADAAQPSTSTEPEKEKSSSPAETPASEAPHQRKKRFTNFHFRKRHQDRNVAGPALAVLDADAQPAHEEGKFKDEKEEEEGVRVTIRLSAVDENGNDLPSPNEQVTYLHVVRFGAAPTPVQGAEEEEDKRPWVVKVVKREATIGLHTFHLHEIYGLSANSTTSSQPTAPPPTAQLDTHTYPPTAPATTTDDEPSSECLLCLSSPREVVLLPCRHLVACRDCALNMIEFGAGGTIVQNESETTPVAEGAVAEGAATEGATEGAATTGSDGATATPAPASAIPPVQASPRRKRKAKGWFCPVCRQPYTSLLRITTTPPEKDEHRGSTDLEDHIPPAVAAPPASAPAVPPPASEAEQRRLRGIFRSVFGRLGPPQPDVERGTAPAANAT